MYILYLAMWDNTYTCYKLLTNQQNWGVGFGSTDTGTTTGCDNVCRYDEAGMQRR